LATVNFFAALELDCQQHVVEQLARLPDKRFSLCILFFTRAFADEQQSAFSSPTPNTVWRATGTELAGSTVAYHRLQLQPADCRVGAIDNQRLGCHLLTA